MTTGPRDDKTTSGEPIRPIRPIRPFVLCCLCFLMFSLPLPAPTVNFRIMDESGTNALRTSVRFLSLSNPSQSSTNTFAVRQFVRANTNSPLAVELHCGTWRVTVGTLTWTIEVPCTNGVYEATDLASDNILRLDDETTDGNNLILD